MRLQEKEKVAIIEAEAAFAKLDPKSRNHFSNSSENLLKFIIDKKLPKVSTFNNPANTLYYLDLPHQLPMIQLNEYINNR